jgi:hypothetical protein
MAEERAQRRLAAILAADMVGYQGHVIGGRGSFIMTAQDIWLFRDAMTQKMLREVEQSTS